MLRLCTDRESSRALYMPAGPDPEQLAESSVAEVEGGSSLSL